MITIVFSIIETDLQSGWITGLHSVKAGDTHMEASMNRL